MSIHTVARPPARPAPSGLTSIRIENNTLINWMDRLWTHHLERILPPPLSFRSRPDKTPLPFLRGKSMSLKSAGDTIPSRIHKCVKMPLAVRHVLWKQTLISFYAVEFGGVSLLWSVDGGGVFLPPLKSTVRVIGPTNQLYNPPELWVILILNHVNQFILAYAPSYFNASVSWLGISSYGRMVTRPAYKMSEVYQIKMLIWVYPRWYLHRRSCMNIID